MRISIKTNFRALQPYSFHPCIWKPQRSPMSTCMDRHNSLSGLRRYSTPEQSSFMKQTQRRPIHQQMLVFCFSAILFQCWRGMANLRNMKSCFNHYHLCNVQQIAPLQSLQRTLPGHQRIHPYYLTEQHLEVPNQLRESGGVVEGIVENQALWPQVPRWIWHLCLEMLEKSPKLNIKRNSHPMSWRIFNIFGLIEDCKVSFNGNFIMWTWGSTIAFQVFSCRFQPNPIWACLKIRWGIIMFPTHWPCRGVPRFQTTTSHTKRQLFGIKLLEALSRLKIWCFKGGYQKKNLHSCRNLFSMWSPRLVL